MKSKASLLLLLLCAGCSTVGSLFDGSTSLTDGGLNGWRAGENPQVWSADGGALRGAGDVSRLFYVGPEAPFRDFDLSFDFKGEAGSNGGVFLRTALGESPAGMPAGVSFDDVRGGDWLHVKVVVRGAVAQTFVNGRFVKESRLDAAAGPADGTIALLSRDPKSVVWYRHVRVKKVG